MFHNWNNFNSQEVTSSQISELENQLERMVTEKQFASVCNDLTTALKREEELEILFQQQAEQIQQVNQR